MNNNDPIVLGKIKKGKTGKPLVVLIIFLFIGSIILFLPTILNYFGDYNIIDLIKNGEIIDFFSNHENYVNKIHNNTTNEIESKTFINSKSIIEYNNFSLSNFILENDKVTYKIKTSSKIDFDISNYYLILKKDNKTSTIKIQGEVNGELTTTSYIKDKLESIIEVEGYIKEIKETDFPNVILSSDESGLASLACNFNNNTIEYIFDNNNLIRIKETLNYKYNNSNDYLEEFEKYTTKSNKIILADGISNITENSDGFIFTSDIDLEIFNKEILKDSNYYLLNTSASKVDFEMKAKGYDCNEV